MKVSSAPIEAGPLLSSTVIVSGSSRTGKTTLGVLLGTLKDAYFYDEPLSPMFIPHHATMGNLSFKLAQDLFYTEISELLCEILLLRKANFRPHDFSSITKQKTPEEIQKILSIHSRPETIENFLKAQGRIFIGMPDFNGASSFCEELGPLNFLEVFRSGHEVAQEVANKRWFCDFELKTPKSVYVRREVKRGSETYHLPWWLKEGDEDLFVEGDELTRGYLYWISIYENAQHFTRKSLVNFDEVLKKPQGFLDWACDKYSLRPGPLTAQRCQELILKESTGFNCPKDIQKRYSTINQQLEENRTRF